jgi:hypothetical protein
MEISQKKKTEIADEIKRLVQEYQHGTTTAEEFENILNKFSLFITSPSIKPKPTHNLTKEELKELKQSIYKYFNVKDTEALKNSNSFKMASSSLKDLDDYRKTDTWERLYRKFIGVLPYEVNKQEYGTINGINIFTYNRPWQVFGLDPDTATTEDVKNSYRKLSKIYYPDIPNTGDAKIFNRLTIFYESLTEKH